MVFVFNDYFKIYFFLLEFKLIENSPLRAFMNISRKINYMEHKKSRQTF